MATITTVELRERVAEKIRIAAVDVELDSERAAIIDRHIGDVTAELRENALCWWPDNAIPRACAQAMTFIVAASCAADCGKAGQGYESLDVEGRVKLASLKPSARHETVRASYF